MANDTKAILLDEALNGTVLILGGEEIDEAFPGGFEEAAEWCAANGMTIAANGDSGWTVERTPIKD